MKSLPIFLLTSLTVLGARARSAEVQYESDVRPIFERACVKCHGPEKQKSGYRLDQAEAALKGGDNSAPNIHPGDSAQSPLIRFVAGLDPEIKMPPKGERLSAQEIEVLRAWIDQGAKWPVAGGKKNPYDWWSLKPLQAVEVPAGENAIDYFVRRRLAEKGIAASREADRRALMRRLYFDLIGLPPSAEEVDAFVANEDPRSYEQLVDKLLASPQYGERWARHWLDVAHYADTHGYDKDQPRPNAWPYRDYVIRALNEDRPYVRFVQEQLAGDVLFPGTRDGIEALGFLSAGPWDLIGHAEVPETKVDGQIARNLDRDDMVTSTMNAFCSLTVQCARCHNHKFDPVTQQDYYGMQAVFAALDRADRSYDKDPEVGRRRSTLQERIQEAIRKRDALLAAGAQAAGAPLRELEAQMAAAEQKRSSADSSKAEAYGYHSAIAPEADVAKWVQVDLGGPVALSKIVLHPCRDDFNQIGEGFGFPVRFRVEISNDESFASGVTLLGGETEKDFANPKLNAPSFSANGQAARYVRVTATRLALRQNDYIFALSELEALDVTEKNVAAGARVKALDSIEAPPRWRTTNLTDGYYPGANRAGDPDELARLKAERDRMQRAALGAHEQEWLAAAEQEISQGQNELRALPAASLVYAGTIYSGSGAFTGTGANGGKPRPIHVLLRGDVTRPAEAAEAGAARLGNDLPARFQLPENAPEGERRAALARWITDPRNPLTWRSIVNRVLEYHFGRGLVDSPNDFGRMGQQPSHPELLDWLAADFRDHGGSLKRLHRLIVTSATYRQSSRGNEAAEKIDSGNVLLWRMNRRKLEAEAVRDAVLEVAGVLDRTMGGPGYRDFTVEKPEHSPHYEYEQFDPRDPQTHRRSIYRFIVRSQPQPLLSALDCADPSVSVDKRNETLTALQALALYNDRLMLAMAGTFAQRVEKECSATSRDDAINAQVQRAMRLALGRKATEAEGERLAAYARQFGMANACRLILNLNEFVFVD